MVRLKQPKRAVSSLCWSSWVFCDAGMFVKHLMLQERSEPGQDRAVPHSDGFLTAALAAGSPWSPVDSYWFILLVEIRLHKLMCTHALWRSCPRLSPEPWAIPVHLNSSVLFARCLLSVLSGGFSPCNQSIPHPPGKLTGHMNPKPADPLWGNPMLFPLPEQFLWLSSPSWGQCQGPLKTSSPAVRIRQDVLLVSVQISKSWFHLQSTDCVT